MKHRAVSLRQLSSCRANAGHGWDGLGVTRNAVFYGRLPPTGGR